MDYPSLGSYDLSPAELFALVDSRFEEEFGYGVMQINHFNGPTLGAFHLLGIDTGVAPPQSSIDPSIIRQDPALANLYDDNYDALELWIENNQGQNARFFEANLGDWFNLLNQGLIKTGTANSDTHSPTYIQAPGNGKLGRSPLLMPSMRPYQETMFSRFAVRTLT